MNTEDKRAEEIMKELRDVLNDLSLNNDDRVRSTSSMIKEYVNKRVYESDTHAQLGRHVEAIMKHFKGLS